MDRIGKIDDTAYFGPYKATRLWNDVITTFRQYLPCGRHRRYMKTFDNCFSGSSATEWLLQYLKNNPNFNEDVSRDKALSLLNKLYKAGIFQEVKVSKTMRHKPDVQENRLYRFLPISPSKVKISRLPLAPRNDAGINHSLPTSNFVQDKISKDRQATSCRDSKVNESKGLSVLTRKISFLRKDKSQKENERPESYPPCHLIARVLTTKEIKDTWKTIFVQRLKKTIGVSRLGDIVHLDSIDGYNVMHNCIYLNKSGIVTNIDAKDQLPHWVMSAMKCLARWPEPPEPGLPSYLGFEKDVFTVVKDYFLGLEEPLVPYSLYEVFTNVFVMAGNNQPRHSSPHHTQEESGGPSSLWTSASLENIILNLTKKYCLLDNTEQHYGTLEDLRSKSIQHPHFGTQEDLRFVSHIDKTFVTYNNQSAFPSTDGMDQLGHSQSYRKLNKFKASAPLHHKSCKTLSRTTQSAREADSDIQTDTTALMRKYGSAPNLKVSRYETAFGPDNRTVTRVFYQNGMTTDFGHDEEEEDSSHEEECNRLKEEYCAEYKSLTPGKLITKCQSSLDLSACSVRKETHNNSQRHSTSFSGSLNKSREHNSSFVATSASNEVPKHTSHYDDQVIYEHDQIREATEAQFDQVKEPKSPLNMSTTNPAYNKTHDFDKSSSSPRLKEENEYQYAKSLPYSPVKRASSFQCNTQLVEAYGPGYRPPRECYNRQNSSPAINSHTEANLKIHSPNNSVNPGLAYKPVLDDSRQDITASHVSMGHPKTPVSSKYDPQSCLTDDYTPGISLSHITPLYSTRGKMYEKSGRESTFINFPQTRLSEERAKNSLQMISLLLPPANRRKLHLLFKMMIKMTSNPNLCLDPSQTTRSLVLGTFYQAIIRSEEECDLDELVVLQLVSFMLDFYADIFAPPPDIKTQVSERLKIMQKPQIVYSPRPERTVRFCQQTSVTDFENQRSSTSQSALKDLLEGIISDKNMSSKEKAKRLKQFEKTYPTIYALRFPNPESEASVLPQKVKNKPSLKTLPISRQKGLRF